MGRVHSRIFLLLLMQSFVSKNARGLLVSGTCSLVQHRHLHHLRPHQWQPPRLARGLMSLDRPPLTNGILGLRGGHTSSSVDSFAKPQRPNLDPDVETYQEELGSKGDRVRELLKDHLGDVELEVHESSPLHYRQRAEFRVWHVGSKAHFALFDPVTKKPMLIEQYPLASERINRLMSDLGDELDGDEMLRRKLFQVEMISNTQGEALICLVYKKKMEEEQWRELGAKVAERLGCEVIIRTKGKRVVIGQDHLIQSYEVGGRKFGQWVTENKFSQSNAQICREMLGWAQDQLRKEGGGAHDHDLIELYCGNGNFTLPLSVLFRRVLATELDRYSVRAAISCAEEAGVSNVALAPLSAAEATQALNKEREFFRLRDMDLGSYDFQTLLVDPPRAGLDEHSLSLAQRFDEVLYISCNPAKLEQDLTQLSTHKVAAAAMFDQFPWTQHAEVAVKLVRK